MNVKIEYAIWLQELPTEMKKKTNKNNAKIIDIRQWKIRTS